MGSGSLAHLAFFKFLWLWQGPPAIKVSERFMGSGPLVGYVKADQGSDSERFMIHGLRLTGSPRIFKFLWLWQGPPAIRVLERFMGSGPLVGYVKADQGSDSERFMIHGLRLTGSPCRFLVLLAMAKPTMVSKRFMGSGSMARLAWPCLSFVGYVKAARVQIQNVS